jgi:hypothetical protein
MPICLEARFMLAIKCFLFNPIAVLALAGCAAHTTRVDEAATTAAIATSGKAVALMRIGTNSPACQNVAALLATAEGGGYRKAREVVVANVRSLKDAPVAEIELPPGEYHVVAFSCMSAKGPTVVADASTERGLYRTSYAHFTLGPGEVANLGYLHFEASHFGRSAFGRPIRIDVKVSDWPLAEIERFKAQRPQLYAAMQTHLVVATPQGAPPDAEGCAKLAALKAEGKISGVPATCAGRS